MPADRASFWSRASSDVRDCCKFSNVPRSAVTTVAQCSAAWYLRKGPKREQGVYDRRQNDHKGFPLSQKREKRMLVGTSPWPSPPDPHPSPPPRSPPHLTPQSPSPPPEQQCRHSNIHLREFHICLRVHSSVCIAIIERCLWHNTRRNHCQLLLTEQGETLRRPSGSPGRQNPPSMCDASRSVCMVTRQRQSWLHTSRPLRL